MRVTAPLGAGLRWDASSFRKFLLCQNQDSPGARLLRASASLTDEILTIPPILKILILTKARAPPRRPPL